MEDYFDKIIDKDFDLELMVDICAEFLNKKNSLPSENEFNQYLLIKKKEFVNINERLTDSEKIIFFDKCKKDMQSDFKYYRKTFFESISINNLYAEVPDLKVSKGIHLSPEEMEPIENKYSLYPYFKRAISELLSFISQLEQNYISEEKASKKEHPRKELIEYKSRLDNTLSYYTDFFSVINAIHFDEEEQLIDGLKNLKHKEIAVIMNNNLLFEQVHFDLNPDELNLFYNYGFKKIEEILNSFYLISSGLNDCYNDEELNLKIHNIWHSNSDLGNILILYSSSHEGFIKFLHDSIESIFKKFKTDFTDSYSLSNVKLAPDIHEPILEAEQPKINLVKDDHIANFFASFKEHPKDLDLLGVPSQIIEFYYKDPYCYIDLKWCVGIPVAKFALLGLERDNINVTEIPIKEYAKGFIEGYNTNLIPFIDTESNRKAIIYHEIIGKGGKGFTQGMRNGGPYYPDQAMYDRGVWEGKRYKAWEIVFVTPNAFLDFFLPRMKKEIKTEQQKLTHSQIALKYVYESKNITRANSNEIAKQYDHNSGEKLFQKFTYYSSTANRKGKPTPCTPKKLQNKINLFQSVIELLQEPNKQRAIDELNILKSLLNSEY